MRNRILIIFFVLVAVAALLVFAGGINGTQKFVDRKTLRKQDKNPYGTNVAYRSLPYLFPEAAIYTGRQEPGFWDSISLEEAGQAFICITPYFNPNEFEMQKLIKFAEAGNDVFISAFDFSYDAEKYIIDIPASGSLNFPVVTSTYGDSMTINLLKPKLVSYTYPGANFSRTFHSLDPQKAIVLGEEEGAPYFIRLKTGKGNFFVHRTPLAFSNYFLLHKKNISYIEYCMSLLSPNIKKVWWDEYYITKRPQEQPQTRNWLAVLLQYPGLRTGIITALITLLIYVLVEMRRKQRAIPVVAAPRNESLDFVKTIGRLYYEKGDHLNLVRKMSAYFLEHVRSKYKLATGQLDDQFIKALQYRSGVEEKIVRNIVTSIKYFEDVPAVDPAELGDFYKQVESFYQKA